MKSGDSRPEPGLIRAGGEARRGDFFIHDFVAGATRSMRRRVRLGLVITYARMPS